MFIAPKSKFVWRVKKSYVPVDFSLSPLAGREGFSPLDSDICREIYETNSPEICKIFETNDQEICDAILKPLSLASLVDLEDGTLLSKSLEAGVEHMDNYILGDSSLRDLGFISPIKVLKGTGSG